MADNRDYLLQAAAARRAATLDRARQAIRRLDQTGHLINFRTVSVEAGVSRSWLYREPAIRAQIERLRPSHPEPARRQVPTAQRASEDSRRQRLDLLHDQIRQLRDENRQLREQLARRLGYQRIDDMTTTQPSR